jgi:shikimate dehydrogenase
VTFFEWRDAPEAQFAVIGDPVEHSRSPAMQGAAFQALGLPYTYVRIRVPAGEVQDALQHLKSSGYLGVNVTVPLKGEACAACASVAKFARDCDAVNAIRLADLAGTNTDAPGFMDTLEGQVAKGCRVLILGAGGSARSIALALALDGYNLSIFNRTPSRAHALVRELDIDAAVVDHPAVQDVQLIVNATSASLQQQPLPVQFSGAATDALAYDLLYGESAFLRDAAEAGLRTMDGTAMLVAQGARSLEFWLGVEAPRDVMRKAAQ